MIRIKRTILCRASAVWAVAASFVLPVASRAQDLTITSSTLPPFQATQNITTSGTVTLSSGSCVAYTAGNQIELTPGFHALLGSTFYAVIASPLALGTAALPSGTVGASYSPQQLLGTGGKPPYGWSALNFPGGLAVSPAGLVSGTPTVAGTFNISVQITDRTCESVSGLVSIVISQGSTTTSLLSSPNPSAYGQSVTLTGSVSPTAATGTMTFKDGSSTLGTAALSSGSGTLQVSSLIGGAHSLSAVYSGDANYASSTSSPLTQTVNQVSTTTSLTASPNPSAFQQTVTLTATVARVGVAGTPTGTVTFYDGTTNLGSGTVTGGTASLSISSLGVGSHQLSVVYGGDSSDTASTSGNLTQVVNTPITVTTSLTTGTVGTAYLQTLTASGGKSPYTFQLRSAGTYPPGLAIASGTTLSGTPSAAGTFTFPVQVSDSSSPPLTATATLSISVVPAISPSSLSFGYTGSSQSTITVNAGTGVAWTATVPEMVQLVSGAGGSGAGTVAFSVPVNGGTSTLTGNITIGIVNSPNVSVAVPVQQTPVPITLSSTSWNAAAGVAQTSVSVTTGQNAAWSATSSTTGSSNNWLTVSASGGAFTATAAVNNSAASRTAAIAVTTAAGSATFSVTQSGTTFSIAPTAGWPTLSSFSGLSATGGQFGSITVTPSQASGTWTVAASDPSWLTLSSGGATGTGVVTLTAAANSGAARSADVVFQSGTTVLTTVGVGQLAGGNGGLSNSGISAREYIRAGSKLIAVETALSAGAVNVEINSTPSGLQVGVDVGNGGEPCSATPCYYQWTPGTIHYISAATQMNASGSANYIFSSWTGLGPQQSQTITVPATATTYTANFTPQYYVTTAISTNAQPGGAGGAITPGSGFVTGGSTMQLIATTNPGYAFIGFVGTGNGSISSVVSPLSVTVNAPITETAEFVTNTNPPAVVSGIVAQPNSNGVGGEYEVVATDPISVNNLQAMQLFLAPTPQLSNPIYGCQLYIALSGGAITGVALEDISNDDYPVGISYFGGPDLSNGVCTVHMGQSPGPQVFGNSVNLKFLIDFSEQPATKTYYLFSDASNTYTPNGNQWVPSGQSLTVNPLSGPVTVSGAVYTTEAASPYPTNTAILNFVATDTVPSGQIALMLPYLSATNTGYSPPASANNSCQMWWDNTNQVLRVSDGTGWLSNTWSGSGPTSLNPVTGTDISPPSNPSICTIHGALSTATVVGSSVVLQLAVGLPTGTTWYMYNFAEDVNANVNGDVAGWTLIGAFEKY